MSYLDCKYKKNVDQCFVVKCLVVQKKTSKSLNKLYNIQIICDKVNS